MDYPRFWDFTEKNRNYDGDVPYSVIFAIEDDTYIWKYNSTLDQPERVHIPKGHMCIFAGDFVHAGDCYDKIHYRVHLYIDAHVKFSHIPEERQNKYMRNINQPIYYELVDEKWTAAAFTSKVVKSQWDQQLPIEYAVVEYLLQERDTLKASKDSMSDEEFKSKLFGINNTLACGYQNDGSSEVLSKYVVINLFVTNKN